MGIIELFLIAVGLSMDAFAAAVCQGVGMCKLNLKTATIVALFFGGFQALMPLLGWLLGVQFAGYIQQIDHWIAFGLLTLIGGKMLFEARKSECDCACDTRLKLSSLVVLAIATSIDALAVGVTFAFLKVSILPSIAVIGATTFVLSFLGVAIGHKFGTRFKQKAEVAGGVVLVLIGLKLLLEHLGLIGF